jgi:flagellar hook-length control protein FliK
MKKPEKAQKTADLSEQNLPGAGAIVAGHSESRAAEAHSTGPAGDFEKIAATASMSEADKVNGSQTSAPAAAAATSTDDARLGSLERTHDLVAMHALRLTQSGNDTLRVVIEPGSGTRLSLELRFNNGAIEAQGVLNHGDFNFLSSHWPELQQQLEPRGIHLADLQCPTGSAMDQRSSQQTGGQAAEEQPPRSAFAEFAFDGSMKDSPAARKGRLKTYAGWETWA